MNDLVLDVDPRVTEGASRELIGRDPGREPEGSGGVAADMVKE